MTVSLWVFVELNITANAIVTLEQWKDELFTEPLPVKGHEQQ